MQISKRGKSMDNKQLIRQRIIKRLEFELEGTIAGLNRKYFEEEPDEELIIIMENELCKQKLEIEDVKAGRTNLKKYYIDLEHRLLEEGMLHILYE